MFRSCEICGSSEAEHPQEHLVAGGLSTCVDRELVPLLRACWSLGLLTYSSCEDYLWSGRSLLEFISADGAQDFLSRVLEGADLPLRRRVLEGTDGEGWSVQASLRELRVEGIQPLLRLGMQVILPAEDVAVAVAALFRRRDEPSFDDAAEDEDSPYERYDARDLDEVVMGVLLEQDATGWDYLAARVDTSDLATVLDAVGTGHSSFLPFREDVPPTAHLALSVLSRLQQDLMVWEEMDVKGYRSYLTRTWDWWERAAAHWPALQQIDHHAPFGGGREVIDYSGEIKLDLRNYSRQLDFSMADGGLDEVLEDLWLIRDQALAMATALDWLESQGLFPHKDPRSPVHRREQIQRAQEHFERNRSLVPGQALRDALLAEAWPKAVAVTHLPDGRHVVMRDLDVSGEGHRASVSEGTREELADLAHDVLKLPPVLDGWACRMVLGAGRKPVRIEFLEYDAQWNPVPASELIAGDVVRLPGNRYAWQVADIHEGDTPDEVQLQLAAPGLPVFGREDRVERWAPREQPFQP